MAFQSVPNGAEVTLVFTQNNENLTLTLHAIKSTGYDLADITALAASVDFSVNSRLLPQIVTECTYLRTEVRGLELINDDFAEDNTNTGPGLKIGPGLPNNVTLSVKKSSGLTGRSARGRVYFPGIPSSALSPIENVFDSLDVDAIVTAVDNLRGDMIVGGWIPVILSRITEGVERPFGVGFDWLTTSAVNIFVDSQRRRLTR